MIINKWESDFNLGETITEEQLRFFETNGVIVFRNFLSQEKVQEYIAEIQRIENECIAV